MKQRDDAPAAVNEAPVNEVAGGSSAAGPVNSFNEWDPLEEVIVGRLDYATIPTRHVMFTQSLPSMARKLYMPIAGRHYPKAVLEPAKRELEGFVRVLEGEGIRVRRPEPMDFGKKFKSQQGWKTKGF